MSELWIALLAAAALIAAVAGRVLVVRLRARSSPAEIADLGDSTSLDRDTGAVRSVQRAQLLLDERSLGEIWNPENLERLARTYWRFLSRVTLGVIRVHYSAGERSVVLLIPQLRLLTFQAPEYEMAACSSPERAAMGGDTFRSRSRASPPRRDACACTSRSRSPTSIHPSPRK